MRTHYDLLVIGFGKAGKTVAGAYAKLDKQVALVEQSNQMYGGTCINIGCVPTKALVHRAEEAKSQDDATADFESAVAFRAKLTEAMRGKNKEILESNETAVLIDGHAKFLSNTEVEITAGGDRLVLTAENIVINTGATSVIPPIEGIKESERVYTSTEIRQLPERPQRLAVIGGGPIGTEFAGVFAGFGTEVTIFNSGERMFAHNDADVAEVATEILTHQGIQVINNARVQAVRDENQETVVSYDLEGSRHELTVDAVLVATGRRPATEGLGLENTDIKLTERGAVEVNETLHTSVENIFAAGDVNGGLQFTYISWDDSRILLEQLTGKNKRSTADRVAVPNAIYMTPPLASVGITEEQATKDGKNILVATALVKDIAVMPRPKIVENPEGMMKFVVDADNDQILGAQLLVVDSHEVINTVAVAMRAGLTASELRDGIYTHPSVTEGISGVLGKL